ncbi:oxygenase MpaB family protein [Noviherbaspirillum aridicola]|uniref:Histidine kinase n=1 Tax=Noviherbaspirillum aridicola TaxID=2849687 RepID=A0ABQ4PZU1_9BURK|nr:oxygenase MpaB family protein [Noviherbaspirillum aridicola]GIZ50415.1 histidine kinase [Noviherbaspirillum aridicola]
MLLPQRPIVLPAPLQRRLEAAAAGFFRGDGRFDFSRPAGEPALVGPDSTAWKIFKNPVTLMIGGIAAVILELAEPRVRAGVWEHTSFRRQPLQRLQRTGLAAMMTVYGPRSQAEAMIARVGAMHARIAGVTPEGQAYRADDPALLDWVQATASFGFIEAWAEWVAPLSRAERDRYYADGQASARLYGATSAPASQAALERLFDATVGQLGGSPVLAEFLGLMRSVPLVPPALAPLQSWMVAAAVELVPPAVAARIGLDGEARLAGWQRRLLQSAARAADRVVLHEAPPAQSCRRLGLPPDYLYRPRAPDASRH